MADTSLTGFASDLLAVGGFLADTSLTGFAGDLLAVGRLLGRRGGTQLQHGNRIGDKGVATIAGALKVNGALMTLNLLENEIGPAGASALVDTLRVNGMLAKLYLGGNKLNDNSKKQVQEVVQGRMGFSLYL